jgi:hypothetical protein
MATRRPLVIVSGAVSELAPGDDILGASVGSLTAGSGLSGGGSLATNQRVDISLAPNPSGLIFVGDALGLDGAAQITANTALASGIAAQTTANAAAKLDVIQTFTAVQTLTDPALIGTITEDIFTITDGAAFEIDPSNGGIQLITLGASRTPKATNFAAGESITLMVDDGSAYTLTWTDATFGGSGVVWKTDNGSAPTLNTTGYTVIVLWKVSTQVYGARVGNA